MYSTVNSAFPKGAGRAYPSPITGAWATNRFGLNVGSNLSALSHTLFRSPGAATVWGTGAVWGKDMLGIGTKNQPGIWKMLASIGTKKYGAGNMLFRALPLAFTGYAVLEGAREGGITGALASGGEVVLGSALFGMGWGGIKHLAGYGGGATLKDIRKLGSLPGVSPATWNFRQELLGPWNRYFTPKRQPIRKALARQILASGKPVPFASALGPLTIGAAAAYGTYRAVQKWADMSINRSKRARRLEFGTPVLDVFGNMATMRMRSLQALQRSSLNGRYALGNEAAFAHSS